MRLEKELANTKKKRTINKTRVAFILCGVLLPWINWLVFWVYVNYSSIVMAFTDSVGAATFEHFVRLWEELTLPSSQIRIAIKNTLITFVIGFVTLPFKVLVSYFIYKKVPGHGAFRILFFLPSIIFGVGITMVFTNLVGTNGLIAKTIGEWMDLGYTPELLADSRFANYTIWAHMLWLSFPGDLIIWGGTFARIPTDVLESGQIDGTNWITEFTKIVVPMVWPTVALQMLLSICGIFGASGAVFLLTGGEYETMTLSAWTYIQTLAGAGQSNAPIYHYLSAVGLAMTVVAVALTFFIRKYTDKAFDEVEF